jgi:hypothetical protein
MKRILWIVVFAFSLIAAPMVPAYGDASQQGCESSGGRAAGCTNGPVSMPEPNTAVLLMLGLVAVGGLVAVLGNKRLSRN